MAYHLVAVDFLPPAVIQASLNRLAVEFAQGPLQTCCDCYAGSKLPSDY